MLEEIQSAEEFFEQGGTYPELAVKFAKLHVKAALKVAYTKARILNYDGEIDDKNHYIDETSILNAYPLEKIK